MNTKVRFLKDHLEHKAGQIMTVSKGAANYFIRTGVAELYSVEDCGCGGPPKAPEVTELTTKQENVVYKPSEAPKQKKARTKKS